MFKKGQLVVLAWNEPYTVSTASTRNMFTIKPGMVGLFLGYAETKLNCQMAIVLFEDVTLAIVDGRLKAFGI